VDLAPEQRERVLDLFARLPTLTPHELLGVPADVDRRTLRAAYHRLIGEFHSDRFFRRRLGSYKPKMDAIVVRVTAAYELLISRMERPAAPRAAPAPAERRFGDESARAMSEIRRRYEERLADARRHAETAERAKAQGDVVGALEAYRRAASSAPKDGKLKAALEEAELAATKKTVEAHARQAEFEERYGHWAEAARSWQRVAEAEPKNVGAHERAAAALIRAGGDLEQARKLAERAVSLDPSNVRSRETLGRVIAALRGPGSGA
jgi:tetratricopeptide (TPR) repeat protein